MGSRLPLRPARFVDAWNPSEQGKHSDTDGGLAETMSAAKLESYLMERELHILGVPNRLQIFPGEGTCSERIPGMERSKCVKS
jgi:hypothetical protein